MALHVRWLLCVPSAVAHSAVARIFVLQPGHPPVPSWLLKWAALALEYVELERQLLPGLLLNLPPPFNHYTQEYADAQAQVNDNDNCVHVTDDCDA